MTSAPQFAIADRQLISRRSQYFAGMREEAPTSVRLAIHRRADVAGAALATFELAIFQQLGETDTEATQQILTADGEKLYSFERIVRTLTMQAVLFDTARDWEVRGEIVVGRGHRAWKRFYERARISQLARSGEIVKLSCGDATWYGAFTTQVLSQSAGDPLRLDLSATFLATDGFSTAIVRKLPYVDVRGRLTAEGAASVGLLSSIVVASDAPVLPAPATIAGVAVRGTLERIDPDPARSEDFTA